MKIFVHYEKFFEFFYYMGQVAASNIKNQKLRKFLEN